MRHHHILAVQHRFATQCYLAHTQLLFPSLNAHDQQVLAELVASAYSKRVRLEDSSAVFVMLLRHGYDKERAAQVTRSFDYLHTLVLMAMLEHKYTIMIGIYSAEQLFASITDLEFKRDCLLHP